ncbi:uncharacterized protein PAC_01974 [Phialocephala subalpina]|uniref:Uncharacterized protein n=1 Tax=Phialocephala subalpina TaxID=576137 RepID=A0A1L7WH94_9HELO|nr:uncharacterized protein PAC_01974 [Phialocephala subalpina]
MSLPEEPNVMDAVSGTAQSTPGPEGPGAHGTELLATQRIELLRAENVNLRIELEEANVRLVHSRICHQSEAQGRQSEAQIRQIIQRGLDAVQKSYFQLATNYKSRLSRYDGERVKLLEDSRIAEELIASQKQLIELYEARDRQQQQSASHLVEGGPLLSQYNDHNHSSQYPTYQPPHSQEFIIDPTRLHPLPDLDYSIGSSIEPCNTDAVMSTPVAEFESQAPILPVQSTLYPTSAEHDVPGSNHNKGDGNKRGPEDEGGKPSKKRKTK